MVRFVLQRLAWAIVLFFVATFITYVIFFVLSPDTAQFVADAPAGVTRASVRSSLHLDVPVWQQYWIFLWNLLGHQSLGRSFQYQDTSVLSLIGREAPVTGSLILGSILFWLLLSIPIGIVSALRPRSVVDRGAMVFALFGSSMSPVVLGLALIYIFGVKLQMLPTSGYCSFLTTKTTSASGGGFCSGPIEWAYHLILPWLTVSVLFAALYARMIRAQIIEQGQEDYVRTAQAKGASPRRVLVHHILRNSMLPLVTMLGMDITLALGAAIFVERIFNIRGLGYQLIAAENSSDVPVVVGITVFVIILVLLSNFVIDVAYRYLDPRIRLTRESTWRRRPTLRRSG